MTTLPPTAVGDLVTADLLNDGFAVDPDAMSVFSSTSVSPLVSAANTDTAIITLSSFPFRAGYAYEISYFFRFSLSGGTGPYNAFSKIKRASSTGTVIHDPANVAAIGTSNIVAHSGLVVVKCTTADTVQTLVLTGAFTTSGSPTSMNISASTAAKVRLHVRKIGLADDFSDALEVPTA